MKKKPLPDLEYLKECFEIDSTCLSGLRWKERPLKHFKDNHRHRLANKLYAGKLAGYNKQNRYWHVKLFKTQFSAHGIVYYLYYGAIDQEKHLDHIDRNKNNNSVDNLRYATSFENSHNTKMFSSNTSGAKGVVWDKVKKIWKVYIRVNGKSIYLGSNKDIDVAIRLRLEGVRKYLGEYSGEQTNENILTTNKDS